MGGVRRDREMGEVVQRRDGVEVKGVARGRLERADAALAQDDLFVALAHDVFGGHEQLFERACHAALE